MAPVGRIIPSGKGLQLTETSKKGKEDECKEESSEDGSFYIKEEEEEEEEDDNDSNLFVAMNEDEGVVIKSEENGEDYLIDYGQNEELDILDDISCKSQKDDDSERGSSQSPPYGTDDIGKSLSCKVCGKKFSRIHYYNLHIKSHDISLSTEPSPNKPHKCQECGKTFALLQHLTGHSRTHIAGRYFECPVCRRKFTELSNLTMHLLKTHPDEKPYKCSECEKQFTQSSALKKHMRTHSSVTSQEEIDRIDMLFYVNNESDKDIEEPLRKKIKLEKDDEISPSKERPNLPREKVLTARGDKSPLKGKSLKEKSVSPKGKSPVQEKLCQLNEKTLSTDDLPIQIKEEYIENDVDESNNMSPDITPAKDLVSPQSKKPSKKASQLFREIAPITMAASPKVLLNGKDSSWSPSKDKLSSLESRIQPPSDKETVPLRNVVPQEKVPNPQVKVMKFAKAQQDSEPLSVKINASQTSPFKSFSGSNENTLELQGIKEEETENENQTSVCNGERGLKGRSAAFISLDRNKSNWFSGRDNKKSEKRAPSPTIEKPDGDYEVRFKCHRCEVFFGSEEKLHEHLMDHTGVKLLECRFCGKDFTKMTSLKRHLYHHVAGNIPQDCTRCGKAFSSFRDLKDHCANKKCETSTSARFKCFRCRKQTSSLKKLKVHLLSQCNEETVKYYVPKKDDGKNCDSVSARDEVSSEGNGVENGFSALASKWVSQKFEKDDFLSKPDMQGLNFEPDDIEALQILSEVDPTDKKGECWNLQCQNCGDKFDSGETAKAHSKIGCKSKPEEPSEKETLRIKVVFEENEDLQCSLNCSECDKKIVGVEKMLLHIKEHIYERNTLSCPVLKCGKLFKDPKDFKLHLKAHTGHKPFKCADCGKRFFLRENYENHAQRHGILKNWSSLNTIIGEPGKTSKAASARSPITIESTIANLEVSESDGDKKMKWTPHATTQPISDRAEFKSSKKQKVDKTLQALNPYSQINASVKRQVNPAVYKPKPPPLRPAPAVINRPEPTANKPVAAVNKPVAAVNKTVPAVNKTVPAVNKPVSAVNKPVSAVHKPVSAVQKSAPTINKSVSPSNRPVPPVNRPLPALTRPAILTNRLSPPLNRPVHASGFVSLTAYPVGPPRSFTVATPVNNKPVFAVATVGSSKLGLNQKDPNARAHPPSYYRVSEHSRAHIQAANAELRKYPRSGRCEVCKKICSRLDKHMMVHLNQKPHLCPVCPQAFRQSEHLRRHIRARHEGNHRQFECPKCHKRLTRKDKLKEHMKNCCRPENRMIDLHATSSIDSHDGPVTLGDSLFDMIPGPHDLPLEGHRVD